MTDENAGAAAKGSGLMWAGGAAAGIALGAALWIFALGPMAEDRAADNAPAEAVATAAPVPAGTAEAEAVPEADAVPEATDTAVAVAPAVEAEPAAEPTADAAQAGPVAEPPLPSFDTVRAEADGTVLVAGRAAPGQDVVVMADGAEVGRATADAAGNFVAFAGMGTSAVPRVLSLMAAGPDGTEVTSTESVILAPTPAPVVAAEAATEAEAVSAAETGTQTADAPAGDEAQDTADAATAGDATDAPPVDPATTEVASADAAGEPAPEPAPAAQPLIVDADGVRKLAPAPTAGVIVDTITYGAQGQVQIAGRAEPGSFARLYLDNAGIVTAPVGGDGRWGAVLTDIAPGIYTLRVDQLDASGTVTSRFETPFQREAPEVVAAAANPPQPPVAEYAAAGAEPEPAADAAPEAAAAEAAAAAAPAVAPADPAPVVTRAAVVTVQPGFTLWQIARENYGDGMLYVKVFEANKGLIRDPDLIYPGQIFAVPVTEN